MARQRTSRMRGGARAGLGILGSAVMFGSCSQEALSGRDWVADQTAEKIELESGELFLPKAFHREVKGYYSGFIRVLSQTFKDGHLYNRSPVPITVYLMPDAAHLRKFCPQAKDLPEGTLSVFVPETSSVYAHASGRQLDTRELSHALMRDISLATIHDMFGGDYPAWIATGMARMFADGALGNKTTKLHKGESPFDWFVGVPDPAQWRSALGEQTLPTFEAVRAASAAEFAAMGEPGAVVATAAVYLLKQLDQLRNVVWQMRTEVMPKRGTVEVLEVMRGCVPRYDAYFSDPVAALFQQRPDIREFLECAFAETTPAIVVRSGQNAAKNRGVGAYWWQFAKMKIDAGDSAAAIPALESCRGCGPHRDLEPALTALAELYYAAGKWQDLRPVLDQLRVISPPTPRRLLMLAEVQHPTEPEAALRSLQFGLGLPLEGFGPSAERLRQLSAEWQPK